MPPVSSSQPKTLRPYQFHGVHLDWQEGEANATGDCPWCGREGKYSVEVADGLSKCWGCGGGDGTKGKNAVSFLKLLWERSLAATKVRDLAELAIERGLLDYGTLTAWGVCKSATTADWLVPAFDVQGRLHQLHRYLLDRKTNKRLLLPTPDLWPEGKKLGLFGVPSSFPAAERKDEAYILEGPWDAMALWEVLGQAKHAGSNGDGRLALTGTAASSLLTTADIYAVPGCGSFNADWTPLFTGRRVRVLFDSDHPRNGTPAAGWAGTRRTVEALTSSSAGGPPATIECLRWGEEGYEPSLKSGWDVRDELKELTTPAERVGALSDILRKVVPVPDDWGMKKEAIARSTPRELTSVECTSWADLLNSWRKALRMRQSLEDALAVCLAVCASTVQSGDNQLFLQMIGDPGSAKTKLCDALLVSKHCFALEHLTGFHSGWKDASGEDFSILSRCNGKTLITPEADVVMSNSNYGVIMSEQRRIFDGTSQAKFKNRKEEMKYTALRTPWIMAGTQKLLDKDQAQLGDRFLKIFIDHPGREEQRAILRRVAFTAMHSVRRTATGDARSIVDANMMEAMCKTGGYVDWLRANIESKLGELEVDEDAVADQCADFAELTAFLRARPTLDGHKRTDVHDAKELPTRLTGQYSRLASCLAVVYNRTTIDDVVMRPVRKVALDTAAGKTRQMIKEMYAEEQRCRAGKIQSGIRLGTLAHRCTMSPDKTTGLLQFLRSVGAVESFATQKTDTVSGGITLFRLSAELRDIWERVMGNE